MDVITLKRLTKNGAFANEVLFLNQQKTYSFGRVSQNDVVLFAPTISKHHCIFHHNSSGLFCEVLKSLAGVVVNGKKYTTGSMVCLHNKDMVTIGLMVKYQVEIKPIVQDLNTTTNFTSDFENDYEIIKKEDLCHVNIKKELELEDATGSIWGDESFNSVMEIKEEFTLEEETQEISFDEIQSSMQITVDEEDRKPSLPLKSPGETLTDPKTIPKISREPELLKVSEFPNFVKEKPLFRRRRRMKNRIPEKCSSLAGKMKFCQEKENRLPEKQLFVSLIDILKNPFYNFSSIKKLPSDLKHLNEKPKPTIKRHFMNHEEKVFSYTLRDKKQSSNYLEIDKNMHNWNMPHRCKKCGKDFLNDSRLERHQETHVEERLFPCAICKKTYKSKWALQNHLKIHSGLDRQTCKICKKILAHKASLEKHMTKHPSKRKFECKICNKPFSLKCDLQKHIKRHTNAKELKCPYCNKSYVHKSWLISHVWKNHNRTDFYECNVCDEIFLSKAKFEVHERIHTGDGPFVC